MHIPLLERYPLSRRRGKALKAKKEQALLVRSTILGSLNSSAAACAKYQIASVIMQAISRSASSEINRDKQWWNGSTQAAMRILMSCIGSDTADVSVSDDRPSGIRWKVKSGYLEGSGKLYWV